MNIVDKLFISWNDSATMWFWLIPIAALTYLLSTLLVKYATGLILKTRLNGNFVGIVLISMVTSIPELVSQITQSASGDPATAISNDLGANSFTVFMMGVIILILFRKKLMRKVDKESKILTIITLFVSIFTIVVLYFGKDFGIGKKGVFYIGLIPIFLAVFYIGLVIFSYMRIKKGKSSEEPEYLYPHDHHSPTTVSLLFLSVAIALIIVSLFLNWAIDGFDAIYHIGKKSAGGLFLSFGTAMPEAVGFFQLAKRGYISAAIGSIFGSHIFNLSQIFLGDIAFKDGLSIVAQRPESLWIIAVMTTILIFIFAMQSFLGKKIKGNVGYFLLPIGIILTYIVGWALIIMLSK